MMILGARARGESANPAEPSPKRNARGSLKSRVGQALFFALAVGFDQAHFRFQKLIQRIPQPLSPMDLIFREVQPITSGTESVQLGS